MAMIDIVEIEKRWIESNKKNIALLVLLEYPYPEIVKKIITSSFDDENLVEAVDYALDFGSNYWAEKAVTWIESGLSTNESIYTKLLNISVNKTAAQNLRHRTTKLVNKWKRSNGI